MKFSMSFDGDTKMVERIKATGERMKAAARQAVYVAGNVVMTAAKQRAPLDTGVLRASGYVTMPSNDSRPHVEVGFGGAAGQYALVQHEHTEYHHDVGEAKYLQKAFDATDVTGIVTKTMRDALDASSAPSVSQGPHRTEPE